MGGLLAQACCWSEAGSVIPVAIMIAIWIYIVYRARNSAKHGTVINLAHPIGWRALDPNKEKHHG